jgi:hypothetical protein
VGYQSNRKSVKLDLTDEEVLKKAVSDVEVTKTKNNDNFRVSLRFQNTET